jgi:uncharacterized protein (UPF0332 family)
MTDYLDRAKMMARSARLLLETGDLVSAVNRAYYAMFEAARAALSAIDAKLLKTRAHATLIRRFGKHVVEERGFDRALGRLFSQTEGVRIGVDYENDPVDEATARRLVDGADRFVTAVDEFLRKTRP